MLSGLLKMSGALILRIVYGKKYTEQYKEKVPLMLFLSALNIFWLMAFGILVSGNAGDDVVLCAVLVAAYPIAITVWHIIERRKRQ